MLVPLFVSLLSLLVLPFAGTDPTSGGVDEGRFLIRGKPILVYPATAPTRHQLIVGVGVPVQDLPHSVVMGWVLKAQYYLPSLPSDYEPVNVENWNDSRRALPDRRRRRRSVERYEVDNVSIRVEPLPVDAVGPSHTTVDDELEEDDGEADLWKDNELLRNLWMGSGSTRTASETPVPAEEAAPTFSVPPPSPDGYHAASSRWTVYKTIGQLSDGYGFGGRACVLRSICEAAEAQFTHTGGVFAELLHIMFSPSTTNEHLSEHRDNEYFRAEQLGRTGAPCGQIFHECSTSLLDMFSGVHDLHAASSSPFVARASPTRSTEPVLSMR